MASSINYHPSFTSSPLSLSPLPSGVNDIVSDTTVSISNILYDTITITSDANVTFTYSVISGTTSTSDINFQTNDLTIYVAENNILTVYPNLPCSISGSTSMSYSLASYNGASIPSWISIDSISGILTTSAPNITTDSSNYFYVNTLVSSYSSTLTKLIKLTVLNCVAQNCEKCSSQSATTCASCSSGYSLNSGNCVKQASETAKALSTTTQSIVGVVTAAVLINNIINTSSVMCLWSLLNQVQMFFILLLTRAYIPFDIQTEITGPDFTLNSYGYIPFKKIGFSVIEKFNFDLTNTLLEPLKVKSDSTIYNTYPFFSFLLIIGCLHVFVYTFFRLLSRCNIQGRCSKCMRLIRWLTRCCVNILTFGYYIRSMLEFNQFFLISSINEIYEWNTSQSLRTISYIVACVLLFGYILMILFAVFLSISSYKINKDEHNKLGEFFSDLKAQNKYRIYTPILMIRRMVYVVILITFASFSSKIVVGVLTGIQILYCIYITFLKPFNFVKDNIIEILNEIYFLILLLSLIFLNSSSDWSSSLVSIYLWFLASNSMIVFVIVLIDLLIKTIIRLKKACKNQIASKTIEPTPQRNPLQMHKRAQASNNSSKIKTPQANISGLYEENKHEQDENSSYIKMIRNQTENNHKK